MKQIAIIGPTASGKSDLSLRLAAKYNALILSIDSLSVYRHIDIASAKPSKAERAHIPHYGLDILEPSEHASVFTFIHEYTRARTNAQANGQNLIIVGGSSFYLKSMLEGLSEIPEISEETKTKTALLLNDMESAYRLLEQIDPERMSKIAPNDRYRIEKMLEIYLETDIAPSKWFALHPPKPFISECPVLDLEINRDLLRARISFRTRTMVENGLIDEVAELERLYGRAPNSMKAIGIIETLDFLDGKTDRGQMIEQITIHTAQLAKRQQTFNSNQFTADLKGNDATLYSWAADYLEQP